MHWSVGASVRSNCNKGSEPKTAYAIQWEDKCQDQTKDYEEEVLDLDEGFLECNNGAPQGSQDRQVTLDEEDQLGIRSTRYWSQGGMGTDNGDQVRADLMPLMHNGQNPVQQARMGGSDQTE